MAVKQVRKAFSKALKMRGFSTSTSCDEAVSADGHIRIVFEGSEWSLYIGNAYIDSHPMEAGSMEILKNLFLLQDVEMPDRR